MRRSHFDAPTPGPSHKRERENLSGGPSPHPKTVRAELVEAPPLFFEAADPSGNQIEGDSPFMMGLVGPHLPLRQAQGERGSQEGKATAKPRP